MYGSEPANSVETTRPSPFPATPIEQQPSASSSLSTIPLLKSAASASWQRYATIPVGSNELRFMPDLGQKVARAISRRRRCGCRTAENDRAEGPPTHHHQHPVRRGRRANDGLTQTPRSFGHFRQPVASDGGMPVDQPSPPLCSRCGLKVGVSDCPGHENHEKDAMQVGVRRDDEGLREPALDRVQISLNLKIWAFGSTRRGYNRCSYERGFK